jgi:hypothetical protein
MQDPYTRQAGPLELLALRLRELRPAPAAWVEMASSLPVIRRALDEIDERVISGASDRAQQTAALEEALRRVEVDPTSERVERLRQLVDRRTDGPPAD